jgi:hypothetical protein
MAELTHLPHRDRPELDLPAGLAVVGGAVLGGVAGYLLLTTRGARLRHDLDGVVDRLFGSANSVLDSWQRARRRTDAPDPSLPFDERGIDVSSGDRVRRRHSF